MACDGSYMHGVTEENLDKVTRMLCGVMAHLALDEDATTYLCQKVEGLQEWWIEHQEADRQRQEREANQQRKKELRKSALSKLTPEERQALGVR